jgi:hypothetical protein
MNPDRRSFIRLGSLALGASCLLRPRSLFALGSGKTPGVLSFSAAEMRVLDFAGGYSSSIRLTGISVLARMHGGAAGMRLLVEVNDFVNLANVLPAAPFNDYYANGNMLSFASAGRGNLIENLSPEDFAARLFRLSKPENVVFAHDALLYDPATKTFTDPFNALSVGELKMTSRPNETPAALEVVLRGTGEAYAAGIPEGDTFAKWKAQLLKSAAHSTAAQPIAAAFVRKLPAFAALAGSDSVKSVLATPLVSSAIESALGERSRTVVSEFDRVRAIFGQSYSDSAVWLYVLFGKQMQRDTNGWVTEATFEDALWRDAFTTAFRIEEAFKSPELKSQA